MLQNFSSSRKVSVTETASFLSGVVGKAIHQRVRGASQLDASVDITICSSSTLKMSAFHRFGGLGVVTSGSSTECGLTPAWPSQASWMCLLNICTVQRKLKDRVRLLWEHDAAVTMLEATGRTDVD